MPNCFIKAETNFANSLAYDPQTNRITTAGYAYDAAGNQTRLQRGSDGTWQRLKYDAAGRLVEVTSDNGSLMARYTYGATNARLVAEEWGLRTYYAWEGGQVIAEFQEGAAAPTTPQWTKNYIYLGGRLLATQTAGSGSQVVQYHHPDRLGTRLVTNAADSGSFEQVSLPYGVALGAESTGATNRRFTSYERSGTSGLDYAINRHYDSLQGRFTQVDPIGMGAASLADPQTLNMYSYCGNDPINYVDPDGLFWGKLFGFIGKVVKWAAVAIAVAVAVIATVLIIAGGVPAAAIVGLFALSAANLGLAFGPPRLRRAITVGGGYGKGFRIGPGGTAVFNPNAGTGLSAGAGAINQYIYSYQDDLPDCSTGALPCSYGGLITIATSIAGSSVWGKIGGGIVSVLDRIVTFSAGFADTITFGFGDSLRVGLARALGGNRAAELQEEDNERMASSWAYTGGQVTGVAWDFVTGGEAAIAISKAAGWGGKFAVHTAHHSFGRFGRLSHLQVNVWKRGVKGSGRVLRRVPLPIRKWPKKEIIIRRW